MLDMYGKEWRQLLKPVYTLRFVGPIWPDLIKKTIERTKIGPIYKNLLRCNIFYKLGRFSSSRYIDKREIDPTNRSV